MTSLVLREVARWVRAVGASLAVLAIVVFAPSLLPDALGKLLRLVPDRALLVTWMAGAATSLAWLITAAVRAALQPAKDARAAQRLQGLRDQARRPDHTLVCVLETRWRSPAGQLVTAVDARTGEIHELWLSETALPVGAFALVAGRAEGATLVDCMHPPELASARRAERIARIRRAANAAEDARIAARHERSAAAEVVHAAERLLRRA